jgi:NitT/TauT family transport system substrate-binding protein
MKKPCFAKVKGVQSSLLTVILLLLLTACTSVAAKPEHPPLRVTWSLWPGWYPMAIAVERDLFTKHGVVVEPIFYDTYFAQLPDLQAHKVDGSLITFGDALLLDGREPDSLRVVLVTDNSAGADSIVATADIAAPVNLRGKRIGANLGTFGELLVRTMLQRSGLTIDEVTLINLDPEAAAAAMPETIDAAHIWEPFTSEALAQGRHIIFSSAETPGLISDVLVFRSSTLIERPEDVRAFIAAWFEALAWWQANPAEGNAIIAKYTGLKPEEISTDGIKLFDLDNNLNAFAEQSETAISLYVNGRINTEFLISSGALTTAPDVKRLLDSSYLK